MKKRRIISAEVEKAFDKIQHPFNFIILYIHKILSKLEIVRVGEGLPHLDKGQCTKPTPNRINGERLNALP